MNRTAATLLVIRLLLPALPAGAERMTSSSYIVPKDVLAGAGGPGSSSSYVNHAGFWEPAPAPTVTPTPTSTRTGTPTPTFTASPTETPTRTPTPTVTASPTTTATPTFTPSPTATPTFSPTPTRTPTETPEPTHTATASPVPTEIPTVEPSITPTPFPFGVRIEIPPYGSPGETFYVRGYLDNPGDTLTGVPTFFVLEVEGQFWFWPRWIWYYPPYSTDFDFETRVVIHGTTPVQVVPDFIWPETGSDHAEGLWLYGAMLNYEMTELWGLWAAEEFGFGP